MNWSDFTTIGTFVAAIVAIYFAVRKHPHEINNIDSETIQNLIKSISEQDKLYNELDARFEVYKKAAEQYRTDTQKELTSLRDEVAKVKQENINLSKENGKLRVWVENLCEQLKSAKIEPCSE